MLVRRPQRLYPIGLALITAIGALLRLGWLDLAEFRREEAWNLLAAADLVAGRTIPLTGMGTSVAGLENGPVLIYLLALPQLLARDVALAAGTIALLNVGAFLASALLAERAFGRVAALFTAATYAVGSWAVYYSRKIWPNDPMPLLSALLALALYAAVVRGRAWALVWAGLCLGLLLNLHPSSFVLVPFALACLLLRPRLLWSRPAFAGVAVAGLVTVPFLLHEVRSGFPALRAFRSVTGQAAIWDLNAFVYAFQMVGPGAYPTVVGGAIDSFDARALPYGALEIVLGGLLALGVIVALARLVLTWRRGCHWRPVAIVLLWLLVPLLASVRRSVPLWNHYLILLLPAFFPFVGAALAAPIEAARGRTAGIRAAATILPVALVLWTGLVQVQGFATFLDVLRQEGARTIYGVPLSFQREAAERAIDLAGDREVVLVSQPPPGAPDGIDDLLPVWRFLLPERYRLRFDDAGGLLRLMRSEALYVLSPAADPAAADLLASRGREVGSEQPLPGSPRGYRYWLAHGAPAAPPVGRLEGGLALDGVGDIAAPDRPLRFQPSGEIAVAARWHVESRPPDEELAFFTQVVDDDGRRLAGRDRAGVEAGHFEAGDELLSWARLRTVAPLEPGRYWLGIGAYRAQGTRRLLAQAPDGRPVGDLIKIGPLKVPLPPTAGTEAALARFDGGIILESARLSARTADLVWRAEARPARDLTVFVHVLDGAGKLVAQHDGEPHDGDYPTGIWDPGERVPDSHPIAPPPGRYRVIAGMYDATTGQRLRRLDGSGDSVELGTLDVAP